MIRHQARVSRHRRASYASAMIVAIDVYYQGELSARAAAIAFTSWDAEAPVREWVTTVTEVGAYEPGDFYRRELPCILEVLRVVQQDIDEVTAVILDGYVWLDGEGRRGLGAHLFAELDESVPVIGVAKNPFAGNTAAVAVLRGESRRPLFVTSAGVDVEDAAAQIEQMHGPYRLPTLLQRVDALSRQ